MAGLSAARALADAGVEVQVLEARERIGGRIWTVDRLDLGAQWIHSTEGNPVTSLCRQLGIPILYVGGDATYLGGWEHLHVVDRGGKRVSAMSKTRSIAIADSVRDEFERWRTGRRPGRSADVPAAVAFARVMRQRSLKRSRKREADWHVRICTRDDWGGYRDTLSAMHWDEGYQVYGYGDSAFPDGYGVVAEHLARGLSIRHGAVVRELKHGAKGVTALTSHGEFHADAAVVTLPLGVLKSGAVKFTPALPRSKRAAIQRLGVGCLAKLALYFDEPFWPREPYVFGLVDGANTSSPTLVVNLWVTHRLPCLVFVVGGELGRELERWPAERAERWGRDALRRLFGQVPRPARTLRTQWTLDPFALGAYSHVAVGATPADFDLLAEPVGKQLLFAGEATCRQHWGCVHGAYVSGLREAARLLDDPSVLPPLSITEDRRWRDMMVRAARFFQMRVRSADRDETSRRVKLLSKSEVFAGIEHRELALLATMFERRTLARGVTLCRAGDEAHEVYVVASGKVGVRGNGQSRVAVVGPGSVIGEYGLVTADARRMATLYAITRTELLTLDYPRFRQFVLAFPQCALAMLGVTVERLKREMAQR